MERLLGRLAASAVLSLALSAGLTWLLRAIITSAIGESDEDTVDQSAAGMTGRRPMRGANVKRVSVFVFIPILAGNSGNRFDPGRGLVVSGRRGRRGH